MLKKTFLQIHRISRTGSCRGHIMDLIRMLCLNVQCSQIETTSTKQHSNKEETRTQEGRLRVCSLLEHSFTFVQMPKLSYHQLAQVSASE